MTLSDISIKRPVFAWMLMAGLLVFGAVSFSLMGISQLPDVDFPVVTVTVTWAGAAPDVMEAAVADIIENSVMSVDGVQFVQSVSQQGQTQIIIQFNLDQDINAALEQVQSKIAAAQKNLPQTIDPPVITKTNPNDQPILYAAAYSESGKLKLRDVALYLRDHLKDRITTIPGVGDVFMGGYVDPQMRIWLDALQMAKIEVTAQDVIDAVNSEHKLAATGYQDLGPKETYVRVQSEFTNAEECNNLFIPTRTASPVWTNLKISDIGYCEEGTDEVRRISRFNGIQPTISLGVIKQHGANAVTIGDLVKKRLAGLADTLPAGLKIGVITDTTVFIRDSVNELIRTVGFAVLLTALVCYLFLGTLSSAVNVLMAIPISLVGSFIILKVCNFTVNTFTLMALTLSIGIVVDDAIMMLENITRHNEEGEERVLAAIKGAREITPAAVAASLAILAIFIPLVFMQGIVGKFFFQFGVTMSVAILLSLLEALTLTPMRCSQFLKVGGANFITKWVSDRLEVLSAFYKRLLGYVLDWRWSILVAASVFFGASLLLIPTLRKEFLPPQDQSRFLVTVYTKIGSSIQFTDGVFREAEGIFRSRPEVDKYFVAVGGFGGGLVNQGISFVTMKDPKGRPVQDPFKKRPSQQEFMQFMRKELLKIPGVERVSVLDLSLTGFSAQRGYPIEFELQGPEWDKLVSLSLEMRKKLQGSGLMSDVDSDYNPNMPQIEIQPDRLHGKARGVPTTVIADAVAASVGGLKLLPNKYTDSSGHRDDIQMKLIPEENTGAVDIGKIPVRNLQGEILPLSELVKITNDSTLLTITRYNRERGIGIFGNFVAGKSQSDVTDFIQKTSKQILPPGYHVTASGSSQAFGDAFKSLLAALILGIFVSYIVLASQFNSFLHPAIILLALPFSLTGALAAMRATDTSLNIYSLIGMLLLMGIVKKNSILLVDFTNQKRREGLEVREALLEACSIRLRPILMTSVATIAGAAPEALAVGSGAELIRPMAIAVIGGVAVSTLLTLLVVPCAYSLCSPLESKRHEEKLHEALVALGEEKAPPAPALAAAAERAAS
ncbi:MAG: efflux RND transporter permease subunit [Bdellovibrionota bacterium]